MSASARRAADLLFYDLNDVYKCYYVRTLWGPFYVLCTTAAVYILTLYVICIGVPLWPHVPYEERIDEALRLVVASGVSVQRVCTGDLHLEASEIARDSTR